MHGYGTSIAGHRRRSLQAPLTFQFNKNTMFITRTGVNYTMGSHTTPDWNETDYEICRRHDEKVRRDQIKYDVVPVR